MSLTQSLWETADSPGKSMKLSPDHWNIYPKDRQLVFQEIAGGSLLNFILVQAYSQTWDSPVSSFPMLGFQAYATPSHRSIIHNSPKSGTTLFLHIKKNPTMWFIYIMEYYSAIQRKFLTHTTTKMKLEVMRQSHGSGNTVGSQFCGVLR